MNDVGKPENVGDTAKCNDQNYLASRRDELNGRNHALNMKRSIEFDTLRGLWSARYAPINKEAEGIDALIYVFSFWKGDPVSQKEVWESVTKGGDLTAYLHLYSSAINATKGDEHARARVKVETSNSVLVQMHTEACSLVDSPGSNERQIGLLQAISKERMRVAAELAKLQQESDGVVAALERQLAALEREE